MLLTSFLPFLRNPWSYNATSLYSVMMLVRKLGEHYKNGIDKTKESVAAGFNSIVSDRKAHAVDNVNQLGRAATIHLPSLISNLVVAIKITGGKLAFLLRSKKCV